MPEELSKAAGSHIYWIQPEILSRRFELRAERSVFGSLSFRTAFGSLATAESATGSWTFKRVGFLSPRVTVRVAGSNDDLAIYWPRLRGDGWLEFPGGTRYHWQTANFWGSAWGFSDAQQGLLFVLRPGVEKPSWSDLLKTQAQVEIEQRGHDLAELPLLVMLGWYLLILQKEDSAAAISATTAAL